jgi:hypothetical protein
MPEEEAKAKIVEALQKLLPAGFTGQVVIEVKKDGQVAAWANGQEIDLCES